MVALKLIAWTDRPTDLRVKDARDLIYLLSHYEAIPNVQARLYDESQSEMMDGYDWDPTLGGAHLLGFDAGTIACEASFRQIPRLVQGEFDDRTLERLTEEMCEQDGQYARHQPLLGAFVASQKTMLGHAAPTKNDRRNVPAAFTASSHHLHNHAANAA